MVQLGNCGEQVAIVDTDEQHSKFHHLSEALSQSYHSMHIFCISFDSQTSIVCNLASKTSTQICTNSSCNNREGYLSGWQHAHLLNTDESSNSQLNNAMLRKLSMRRKIQTLLSWEKLVCCGRVYSHEANKKSYLHFSSLASLARKSIRINTAQYDFNRNISQYSRPNRVVDNNFSFGHDFVSHWSGFPTNGL